MNDGDPRRNAEAFRRFFEVAFNECRLDVVDEIVDPEVVNHSRLANLEVGPGGMKELMLTERRAIPDFSVTVEETIAEGDKVACVLTATGTQVGELFGFPPTGRPFRIEEIEIGRFAGGRLVELWSVQDTRPMVREMLGVNDAPKVIVPRPDPIGDSTQTADDSRAVFRRLYEDAATAGDLEVVDEVIDPDVFHHAPCPGQAAGAKGIKDTLRLQRQAFGDFAIIAHDVIAEADMVVGRFTVSGTHEGEFQGIAPTGRRVQFDEMLMARVRRGKIVELRDVVDALSLMTQSGAVPG